jgi:hypothetical protein
MSVLRWAAIGTAAVTVAALGACTPESDDGDKVAGCTTPPATIATQAADAGALRVVESGFTQLGPNKTVASIGAILENTGDRVAYRARVTFRVTKADGTSAVPASSGELLSQEIPLILPKQKVPIGTWTYVEGQVSAVTVQIGPATWVPAGSSFAEITTAFQSLARTGTDPETASVSYKVTSRYCRDLIPRGAAIVFREASGKIVGGSFELGDEKCPPGVSPQRSTAQRSAPLGIDESKTQVYPYCDFRPAAAPKSSGGPVN